MSTEEINHLKSIFQYDPETGILRWKVTRSHNAKAGAEAGHQDDRYRRVDVQGKSYQVHRIAFALMTGRWPADQLDHINRVKTDNRWANLREATGHENQKNRDRQANNTSGYAGVAWHIRDRRWRANIKINRKRIHLGSFGTKGEAVEARFKAEEKYYGAFRSSYLD